MARVGLIYYGKSNYYELINYIRHYVREEFFKNQFKIISFFISLGLEIAKQ